MSPRPIEFPVEGLSDGVVRLRVGVDTDVPRIVEACRDPDIARYTTVPSNYLRVHAEEWLRRGQGGLAAGAEVNAVITRADEDRLLGAISLHEMNRAAGRAATGYWIAPWARREGLAPRALRLICRFGFDELGLERIEATIEAENRGSVAVAEAVGFRREGHLRSYMPVAGARRDMEMYALLPDDLRP